MNLIERNVKYLNSVEINCKSSPELLSDEDFLNLLKQLQSCVNELTDAQLSNSKTVYAHQLCKLINHSIRMGLISGLPMEEILDVVHEYSENDEAFHSWRKLRWERFSVFDKDDPESMIAAIISNPKK